MRMLGLQEQLGLTKFVSMQNHYNLIYREEEREMLPLCREMGIAVTPWSPLARGVLTGSRKNQTIRATTDTPAHSWYNHQAQEDAIVAAVEQVASARGIPPAHVALAWVCSREGITSPIVGASKTHHLDDAVAALSLRLSEEDVGILQAPYYPRELAGHQ